MKLIVVTPAGRERYLRLLSHYVLGSPEVTEWQLWDNCRTDSDRAYLRRLAESDPRCTIKTLQVADGTNDVIGQFFAFCDDPDALYLRLDDDIVFVEEGFFPKFKARAEAERGKALWLSPVVINNAMSAWFLKHFAPVVIEGRVTCQAMCSYAWRYPHLPKALHPVFIDAVKTGRLDQFRFPSKELRYSRFSINAIGFFGADKMAIGSRFDIPDGDEEDWLSAVLPALEDRPGKVLGDLAVAHFSYNVQEQELLKTDILERYYALAGVTLPERLRPVIKPRLSDTLRPWRVRRRQGLEPHYRVYLSGAPETARSSGKLRAWTPPGGPQPAVL